MKKSLSIVPLLLLVLILEGESCQAQAYYGSDGDGSSFAGSSIVTMNDQNPYLYGGTADGSGGSVYTGGLVDHALYCGGGPGDGSSHIANLCLINGNLIYCFGGISDGASRANLLASMNHQPFYCTGGPGDGISMDLFTGPMAVPIAFFGGAGDGQSGGFTGPFFLLRGLWTGLISDDWNDPGNWNGQALPDGTTDVFIPTTPKGNYFPLQNSGSTALSKDLTVHPGASLTVPSGKSLAVNQDLLVRSDATGIGSLIDHGFLTVAGTSTVDLYLTPDTWHYVSSPVGWVQSGVFTGHYLYNFMEATDDWNNIIPVDVSLSTMMGYAAWVMDNPATVHFEGPLHTGEHDITVTRNSTLEDQGWNLVGNPYTSAVDWDAPGGWLKENVDNTIYFYQGTGGLDNYRYYIGETGATPAVGVNSGTNEIPPMQGFFVHASAQGKLTVNNTARIHSSQPYYKQSAGTIVPMVRLQASHGDCTDEMVVRFTENATANHDGRYDAFKMFSADYPQVYSITPDKTELAINTLPSQESTPVVPVGFQPHTTGSYLMEATGLSGLDEVWLEDLLTGQMQRLNDFPQYAFEADISDNPNRFLLHFGIPDSQDRNGDDMKIYSWGSTVFIRNPGQVTGRAFIFSVTGQVIASDVAVIEGLNRIHVPSGTGFYMVKVVSGTEITTGKVFITD